MAIQTVTNDNLAEYVAERQAKGSELSTGEQVVAAAERIATATGEAPKTPVVAAVAETTPDAPPDPGDQTPSAKKVGKGYDERINELTRLRKETEEFAEDEYNARLRAERRIGELESQLAAAKPVEKPIEEELKRPSPKDFADQESYDTAMEGYETKRDERIARKVAAETEQRLVRNRQDELMRQRIEVAKVDIPDFVEVIEAKDRLRPEIPLHVQAAIIESELGPQLAYHLAKHPDDEKRIFALTPAKALLELGKIEQTYMKAATPKANGVTQSPPRIETTRAPVPITPMKADGGIVNTDLSAPMGFQEYRKARLEDIRKRGRRH